MKYICALIISIISLFIGAEIVHRIYFPQLMTQEKTINRLLNSQGEQIEELLATIELCREEYVKQHRNGRDFITNALGLKPLMNHK